MSLYTAETRRLSKRRFVRILMIGVILVLAAVAVGTFLTNQKIGPAQQAKAAAQAQADYQGALEQTKTARDGCEAAKQPNCAENYQDPTPDQFSAEWHLPGTFNFAKNFPDMLMTLAILLALAAFVIGASFAGAEWSSGGVSNLLLWRPQRLRVISTKLAALLVWLAGITVVLGEAWIGVFYFVAKQHGTLDKMTAGAWRSTELAGLRAVGLVLVAGAAGFALAMIGRHTAVALGVAVGAVVVLQFGLVTVLNLAKVQFADAYLLPFWAAAWLRKSYVITDYNGCDFSAANGCEPPEFTMTWHMAGYGLAGVFVVLTALAIWTFRKRDIS